MGVKGLIQFLRKEFPNSFTSTSRFSHIRFDEIYVDLNPALHQNSKYELRDISEEELNRLSQLFNTSSKEASSKLPFSRKQMEEIHSVSFFKTLYNSLINGILCKYIPSQKLYFSLDGPAPLAKFKTQRGRRILASEKLYFPNSIIYDDKEISNFSSLKFTPGNLFMGLIDRVFIYILQDYLLSQKNLQMAKDLIVIYDHSCRNGESDLKILNEVITSAEIPNSKLICSSDSDSVLQLIAQCIPNSFAVDPYLSPSYSYSFFSLDAFMNQLKLIDPVHFLSLKNDLIFLSLLNGNDYFPPFKNMHFIDIWNSFVEFRNKNGSQEKSFINLEKKAINLTYLKEFLTEYLSSSNHSSMTTDNPIDYFSEIPNSNEKAIIAHERVESHLKIMLWSLNMLFTGYCTNPTQYLKNELYVSPSLLELLQYIENKQVDKDKILWISVESPVPLKDPFIPVVSSLLLFDDDPSNKILLPKCLYKSHDHFQKNMQKFSESESMLYLMDEVSKIPSDQFSPLEQDFSFSKTSRTLISLNLTLQNKSESTTCGSKDNIMDSLFTKTSREKQNKTHTIQTENSMSFKPHSITLQGRAFHGLMSGKNLLSSSVEPMMSFEMTSKSVSKHTEPLNVFLLENEMESLEKEALLTWHSCLNKRKAIYKANCDSKQSFTVFDDYGFDKDRDSILYKKIFHKK